MIFWPHGGNLDKPPEVEDLRYRRPVGVEYWEASSGHKKSCLAWFWVKWKRITGKEYPRKPPSLKTHKPRAHATNRIQGSRRPPYHGEKNQQDANS